MKQKERAMSLLLIRKLPLIKFTKPLNKLHERSFPINNVLRYCATTAQQKSQKSSDEGVSRTTFEDYDDYDGNQSQGRASYFVIALRIGVLLAGLGCVGLTVNELLPKRMSANSLFSEAFDAVRKNDEILYYLGDSIKAYGRDMGRNEGRRNHIDSYTYKGKDGSNRLRVRFNIEGPRGVMMVFAEVMSFIF